MGWVSILDPRTIAAVLEVPPDWKLIGYFCLRFPEAEDDVPALERLRWEERRPGCVVLASALMNPPAIDRGTEWRDMSAAGQPTMVDGPLGRIVWRVSTRLTIG